MLKALELVGFKSFADKTRLDFNPGITAVVGPNGSGKSNVVDAIKWVLGEQSVKSLRGREMADVIFNGSGSRRAVNSAEITLTLDNSSGRLAIDTPEVYITRRVYRSGEGEYLLNRQPCRLRDIRDLLAGTGMGTEAYSIIEQGKVDVLLQSSARDRRLIFEEAAGISRFKAKKVEAARRLERVDQNLLRLSDIVEEVDSRLRSVRAQAGKARRYKEYTDRLQELRTQVGLVDWRRLTDRLTALEAEAQAFTDERDAGVAQAEALEAHLLEIDAHVGDITETIRTAESQISANRERIAGAESSIDHERARHRDLEQEISKLRRNLVTQNARAGDVQQQMTDTSQAVSTAETEHREIARQLAESERMLTELMSKLDQARGQDQQARNAIRDQMRVVAQLGNEIGALESKASAAEALHTRVRQRITELSGQIQAFEQELTTLRLERDELAHNVEHREGNLSAARAHLATQEQRQIALQHELAQLRERLTGVAERASVLEELEKRQEGISAGVKAVLAQARQGESILREIRGLVADLLRVSVEAAPLIEAILGQTTQYLVAPRNAALIEYLQNPACRLNGRVGLAWLDDPHATPDEELPDLCDLPGVMGRADEFVEVDPQFAPLARRLLSRAWVVETLPLAMQLAETKGRGLSFVTLAGELLSADGTLILGPREANVGLISRRSQLRALVAQRAELEQRVAELQDACSRREQQIVQQRGRTDQLAKEYQSAVETLGEQRFKITAAEQQCARLDEQLATLQAEAATAEQQHQKSLESLDAASVRKEETESQLGELESRLSGLTAQTSDLEAQQQTANREATERKVELAKAEERLGNLRTQLRQFEESRHERERAISESRDQLTEAVLRLRDSAWNILQAESEIAELYLRKELSVAETGRLVVQRAELQQERSALTAEAQQLRAKIRKAEEKIHAKQLEANEFHHERNTLVERLREDYGIELAQLEREPTQEELQQREAVQGEIDELRRKIGSLGNVNLEALEELQQLESRYGTLSEQYKDLTGAKAALEKIIEKINADSRRLFADTLQTIKDHFQTLFRDLFGGGRADIVLDEGVDILESGIEIVARPPGKEPRNISLLSGGEKTMTCVALLLAIFRSRPSPFCVLDEVDAALDEANIDRFIKVLQDFLAWTQFIIITHSKKTMTCANTIYGVTMQESGVSKQVSVRFEDVSEDGHIRQDQTDAASQADDGEEDTQAA
jgi:chromosome segregation protein